MTLRGAVAAVLVGPVRIALLSFAGAAIAFFCILRIESDLPAKPVVDPVLPGMTLESSRRSDPGLVVTSIRRDGEARRQGIAVGDEVLAINGMPARPGKSRESYGIASDRNATTLTLLHQGQLRRVILDLTRD